MSVFNIFGKNKIETAMESRGQKKEQESETTKEEEQKAEGANQEEQESESTGIVGQTAEAIKEGASRTAGRISRAFSGESDDLKSGMQERTESIGEEAKIGITDEEEEEEEGDEEEDSGRVFEEDVLDVESIQEEEEEDDEEEDKDERTRAPVYLPDIKKKEDKEVKLEMDEETGEVRRVGEEEKKGEEGDEDDLENTVKGELMLTKDGKGLEINHPNSDENIIIDKDNFNEDQEFAYEQLRAADKVEQTLTERLKSLPLGIGGAATIGDAIGSIYGQRKASNKLDEKMNRNIKVTEGLRDEFQKAIDNEDFEKAKHINKLIGSTVDEVKPHSDFLKKELEEAPSKMEVAGSGMELAGLATMFYNPGKVAFPVKNRPWSRMAAEQTPRIRDLTSAGAKTKAILDKYIPIALKSGSDTALLTAGQEARTSEDADVDEIIQAAEGGFKFGAAIGTGLSLGGDMLSLGFEKAKPKLRESTDNLIKRLDQIAEGGKQADPALSVDDIAEGSKEALDDPIRKALSGVDDSPTIKQKLANKASKTLKTTKSLKQKFIDRHAPLERMEEMIRNQKGAPLDEGEKVFRDARMHSSWSAGLAEEKVRPFYEDVLSNYSPAVQEKAKAYLKNLDDIDRLKLGQEVSGEFSDVPQAKANLTQLVDTIGSDDMKKVGEIRRGFKRVTDQNLLDDFNSGLISKKEYQNIIEAHPNYIPHNVISDTLEEKAKFMGDSKSLNVSSTHIKEAFGSNKQIEDPFVALAGDTLLGEKIRQKNKILNNLVDSQKQYDVLDGAKKLGADMKPEDGYDVINFFRNGEKQRWQVPKTIGESIKGINSSDFSLGPLSSLNRTMKKGATSWNPAFIVKNKIRDVQRASQYADPFIRETAEKYGFDDSVVEQFTGKQLDDIYSKGGIGSSIFREGREAAVEKLTKSGISSTFSFNNVDSVSPLKAIENVNLAVEQSTRKEVLARALNAGLSKKDAVWAARNTSVDYGRMGTWMKGLNEAIPFLNAQAQGLTKLSSSVLKDPSRFAEATYTTAVLPTMQLHQHNRRYDSYKYINRGLKANNWVIMTGEIPTIDPDTNSEIVVPQYVTIPRGEGQSALAAPFQWMLEEEDNLDSRKVDEMLADTVLNASPADFGSYRHNNFAKSAISKTGPVTSGLYAMGSGEDPYFGGDIVPPQRQEASQSKQFDDDTPEILKDLPDEVYDNWVSESFNISPSMAEYYTTVFGTGPKQLLEGIDITYNRMRDDKVGNLNPVTDTMHETFSELPGFNSFFRQSTYNVSERDQSIIDEARKEVTDDRIALEERAKNIVEKSRDADDTRKEFKKQLKLLGDDATPELIEEIESQLEVRSSVDGLRSIENNDVKAMVIEKKVGDMRDANKSKDEIRRYLQRLNETDDKILTNDVMEKIMSNLEE